ncbi:MAG: PAS domain-containing protein, partial [Blastococcus sp.]
MTAGEAGTAVLHRPVPRVRLRRRLSTFVSGGSVLERSLPSTAMFAGAAVLLATGALPVVDGELVLAGLATASLATLVSRLVGRPSPSSDGALLVPLAHLGAAGLLSAGSGSAAVFFLLLGPLLTLASGPGRRGVLVAAAGTAAALLLPAALTPGTAATEALPGALLLGPFVVGLGGLAVNETTRRLAAQAAEVQRLQGQRAALLTQVQSRADELDLATRMLAARAQTMTSVIDAVTEQSIIGTDRDGVIRVWNPGAEKMLGLARPEVVRKRSIVEFHLPEELDLAAEDAGAATGLAALVHAAQAHGSDVRDWTYVAADGDQRTVSVAVTPRTDDRGVHAGWNFVGTDMTEARATERM